MKNVTKRYVTENRDPNAYSDVSKKIMCLIILQDGKRYKAVQHYKRVHNRFDLT
jgi:hypothetical protein